MQARPRNLPRRLATPLNLLPGFSRPVKSGQKNQAPKVIRKSSSTPRSARNPLPRRRLSERAIHIMHETGLLQTFERPDDDPFASTCVSETRAKICGEIHERLIWRASRKAAVNLWVSKPVFSNLIFRKCDEDHIRWTITKPKTKRGIFKPGKTTVRVALNSQQFANIFGFGSDSKRETDENKRMYVAKIFNEENDLVRISYCTTTGALSVRFDYKFFHLTIDPTTGLMDYMLM